MLPPSFRETLSSYLRSTGIPPMLPGNFAFAFIFSSHGAVLCCPTEGFPSTYIKSHHRVSYAVVGAGRIVEGSLRNHQRRITVCVQRLGATSETPNIFYYFIKLGGHLQDPQAHSLLSRKVELTLAPEEIRKHVRINNEAAHQSFFVVERPV